MQAYELIGNKLRELAMRSGEVHEGQLLTGGLIPEVEIELDDAVIAKTIGSLRDLMTSGFEVNRYVSVKSSGELNFKLTPSREGINLKIERPYPKVVAVGGLVEMSITGIKRFDGGLIVEISGAPDLTVRFK